VKTSNLIFLLLFARCAAEDGTYMDASFILCRDRSVVVEPVCSFSRQFARDSLGGDVSETRRI
jgi:hypothetical protein